MSFELNIGRESPGRFKSAMVGVEIRFPISPLQGKLKNAIAVFGLMYKLLAVGFIMFLFLASKIIWSSTWLGTIHNRKCTNLSIKELTYI